MLIKKSRNIIFFIFKKRTPDPLVGGPGIGYIVNTLFHNNKFLNIAVIVGL